MESAKCLSLITDHNRYTEIQLNQIMSSNYNTKAENLEEQLNKLESTIERIPSPDPPPRTTLQIQGDASSEGAWQNYLSYFLDPTAPHGLGTEALNQFLQGLREESNGNIPAHAPENIVVETESLSDSGNQPDLIIHESERFFICCELKLYSPEGENQTIRYANDDKIGNTPKNNFPDQGHHYVYLKRQGHRDAASNEFINITWNQVKDWLTPLLLDDRGRYPTRTTAQLSDFLYTIQQDMTEDDHIKTEREKMELYLQHQEAIEEARQSFKTIYEHERDNWQHRFLREFTPDTWSEDWNCNSNKYGQIYHSEWRPERLEIEDAASDLQFVHLIRDLESFQEGKLTFQLRWPGESLYRERFMELFVSKDFAGQLDPILAEHGIKKRADYSYTNPRFTEKVYLVAKNELPDSYYETLSQAVEEHQDLAPVINEILSTAIQDVEKDL